jgi:hypothetical protein
MSSGVVVVAPHFSVAPVAHAAIVAGHALVTVAVAAAAVVAVGAAAVLLTRAAAAGTQRLARGVLTLAELMDRQEQEAVAAERAAIEAVALWDDAASLVVACNARIGVLQAAARRDGRPDVPIPPPVPLDGLSLAALYARLQDTTERLVVAEAAVAEGRARAARERVAVADQAAAHELWEVLRHRRAAVLAQERTRAERPEVGVPDSLPASEPSRSQPVAGQVEHWLSLVDPGVSEEDYVRIVAHGIRARATGAGTDLDALGFVVRGASVNARRQREDSLRAQELLDALWLPAAGAGWDSAAQEVIAALTEVRDGTVDLEDDLLIDAEELVAQAQAAAERAYLLETMRRSLSDLEYEITAESDPARALDVFTLRHSDLPDHSVRIVLDKDEMRAATVSHRKAESVEDQRADDAACGRWVEDSRRLQAGLRHAGIDWAADTLAGREVTNRGAMSVVPPVVADDRITPPAVPADEHRLRERRHG